MANRNRHFLSADIQAVSNLLEHLPAENVLDRIGLEHRLAELQDLASVQTSDPQAFASVELQFGGSPVFGDTGIDARFGARMVDAFQRAVATAAASAGGASIGSRGPLPEGIARLHVTDVVRGSFGFRLEELGQQELHGSKLREAVAEIEDVLASLTRPDDEAFIDAVENVDPRVVTALKDFMSGLNQARAVCRVVAPDREIRFDTIEVTEAAAKRILSYQVTEEDKEVPGVLWGVLPESRRFEFKTDEGEMLKGRVGRDLDHPEGLQALSGTLASPVFEPPSSSARRVFRAGSRFYESRT